MGWQTNLIYAAVIAVAVAALLVIALVKKGQYDEEARNGLLAEVWLPSGRPVQRVIQSSPDGWVRMGRLGDYRLAVPRRICECGHDESDHQFITVDPKTRVKTVSVKCHCGCTEFKEAKVIPAIRRWAKYPSNPFLGIKAIQTWIRTEAWYLNNPEPITPTENRTKVTAIDAQAHTREMDAQNVGIRIQESEARQKQLQAAIENQPNKMLVYGGLGGLILLSVIVLVQLIAMKGG